ncbi:hypothetical protein CCP2SC5_130034 [Azospirillaceae bacterium]
MRLRVVAFFVKVDLFQNLLQGRSAKECELWDIVKRHDGLILLRQGCA